MLFDSKFIATKSSFDEYKKWLATEAQCLGCGRRFADRPTLHGRYIDIWITETCCSTQCDKKTRSEQC